MNMLSCEVKKMAQKMKEYLPFFVAGIFFSVVIYYLLISNQLVNSDDGLWEYSYYKAGRWSLSLGRWFWLYLDRLRLGISTEPVTSLLTLSCYSLGFVFILDLFELGKNKIGYLVSMLFLSSTAVCISLSYRYMSPTFGLAFLLSVVAPWILIKWQNRVAAVFAGGIFIAFSMGLYQAYLGCTCIILVGYFIYILQKEDTSLKSIITDIFKVLVSAAIGGLLYIVILNVHLRFFHTGMSDYNGGNMYSLGNTIKSFGESIAHTYRVFIRYFIENYYKTNALQQGKIYFAVFLFAIILLIIGFVRTVKLSKAKAILYILFVLAIPVASNAVLLIATSAWTSLQMTAPMALCIPILVCVETKVVCSYKKWLERINILALAVLLYGNIYQVQIDQNSMLEGKIATTTMANEIIHSLSAEGCLDADLKYCVIGVPAHNDLFKTSLIYEKSNGYARFGSWTTDYTCSRRSWQGVFSNLCGIDLEICTADEYGALLEEKAVQNMGIYPNKGYITQVGDIVIIKVSE